MDQIKRVRENMQRKSKNVGKHVEEVRSTTKIRSKRIAKINIKLLSFLAISLGDRAIK